MVTLVPSPNRSLKLAPPAVTQWSQHEHLPTGRMAEKLKLCLGVISLFYILLFYYCFTIWQICLIKLTKQQKYKLYLLELTDSLMPEPNRSLAPPVTLGEMLPHKLIADTSRSNR